MRFSLKNRLWFRAHRSGTTRGQIQRIAEKVRHVESDNRLPLSINYKYYSTFALIFNRNVPRMPLNAMRFAVKKCNMHAFKEEIAAGGKIFLGLRPLNVGALRHKWLQKVLFAVSICLISFPGPDDCLGNAPARNQGNVKSLTPMRYFLCRASTICLPN